MINVKITGDIIIRIEPGKDPSKLGIDIKRVMEIKGGTVYVAGFKPKTAEVDLVELGKNYFANYEILGSFTPKESLFVDALSVEEGMEELNDLIEQGYKHGYGGEKRRELQCFELTNKVTYVRDIIGFKFGTPNYDMKWYLRELLESTIKEK